MQPRSSMTILKYVIDEAHLNSIRAQLQSHFGQSSRVVECGKRNCEHQSFFPHFYWPRHLGSRFSRQVRTYSEYLLFGPFSLNNMDSHSADAWMGSQHLSNGFSHHHQLSQTFPAEDARELAPEVKFQKLKVRFAETKNIMTSIESLNISESCLTTINSDAEA